MTRYLIIGNGATGVTAAEEIRAHDRQGRITLISAEPYPMYSRPGLAYVIINEIPEKQVIARRPEWYTRQQIKVVYGSVTKVEAALRQVALADGRRLPYDKLLIATGARAVPLPYPGSELDGVVFLDTLDGTRELINKAKAAKRAVVIGGGITALEMAEGLAHHRLDTHYFVRKSTLWSTVFNDVESKMLEARMIEHGVKIHYNTEIAEVLGDKRGRVAGVKLTNGSIFKCDLVGAGIGVKPQLDLIRGTPIKTDRAILVNEYLETSEPNIYAAGDCAQIWDRWTQKHTLDVLWPTAIAAGRIAGANMTGKRLPYLKGTPFNACLLFGLHITAIGQLGGTRDEAEPEIFQHLSRGASEIWATQPRAYASAWSQSGPNTIRLALSGERLVGALVVGEQTLADPLRDLIERQVDIRPIRSHLEAGGPAMNRAIKKFWEGARAKPPAGAALSTLSPY
ncbi:MAG: NAD(P)/FAD-dependent oxidoreductase [Chloroflexi bacterium]|nr:NAD(P)/FAD-dependent oxidoreductase [Chloroflexota bacterium]